MQLFSVVVGFALFNIVRCQVLPYATPLRQTGRCENPVLHFLFLVYDRIHNGDLWERFFGGAAADTFFVGIQHSKKVFFAETWPASLSEKTEILHYSKKVFRYARYVHASNNLLGRALNRSRDPCDQFLLLSADAVPIVKFESLYSRFVSGNNIRSSSLCITNTQQWIQRNNVKNEYYVKHHNWWVLNKENATHAHNIFASMASRNEDEEDLFGKETDGFMSKDAELSHYATDEFWHYKVLFGNYDVEDHPLHTAKNPLNLQYPSKTTGGDCSTFVYWGPSTSTHDIFARASYHWDMKEQYMDGIHISRLPLRVVIAFYDTTKSHDFVLLRKITKKTSVFLDNDVTNRSDANMVSFAEAVLSRNLL